MFSFTCPNPSTHPLVSASQKLIELLEIAIRTNHPKFLLLDTASLVTALDECTKDYIKGNYRRSGCNRPMCINCQRKKKAKNTNKTISALLTFLLGDLTEEDPIEMIEAKVEARSVLHLTVTISNCSPQDIRSSFDIMNKAIATLLKRPKLGEVGCIRFDEITFNNDPTSPCHPHLHILIPIDASDNKIMSFWGKDHKDIIKYLRQELMKLMKLDYLPRIKCETYLTGSEVYSLTTRMYNTDCKTLNEYSKYIEKNPKCYYSSPITDHSNIDQIAFYLNKASNKALMIKDLVEDDDIDQDIKLDIIYHLLADLDRLHHIESAGLLKLPTDFNIKTWEDFI